MSTRRTSSPAAKKQAAKPAPVAVVAKPPPVAVAPPAPPPTSVKQFLQVWWSLLFAVGVLAMQCTVEPKQTWTWPPKIDLSFKQALSVFSSPWFWACWGPLMVGIYCLRSFFKKHCKVLSTADQGMMVWWLTNMLVFHIHCDVLSGYFQVMPALTGLYSGMTPAHLQPRWADARLHLDATYFLELVAEAPLAGLMLILYFRRHPGRHFVECFALAVQAAGTITYYAPPIIRQEPMPSWVCLFDRGFGSVWILFPLSVLWRHFSTAAHVKKE